MRQRAGYALCGMGLIVALAAYALRSPEFVMFNNYLIEVWELWEILGVALLALGALMVFRSAAVSRNSR